MKKPAYITKNNNLLQQISTNVRPVAINNDYASQLEDVYSKVIPVCISDSKLGNRNAELIFRIQKKSDPSNQRFWWVFELTEEK